MTKVFTIGYEGVDAEDVISALKRAGVKTLLDVRIRPQSRKPNLSKTSLGKLCEANGIQYHHDRRLGTPIEILRQHRETGFYDWDAYEAFLATQTDAVLEASKMVREQTTCMLCYEADPSTCHRRFVATAVAGNELEVKHLRPKKEQKA